MVGTQRRKQAVTMKMQGMTYREIADRLGVTRQPVQQYVRPTGRAYTEVRERANGRCERCKKPTTCGHVHHVSGSVPVEEYQLPSNLLYLCIPCHKHADVVGLRGEGRFIESGSSSVTLHVKIPIQIYLDMKRQAKKEMRSVHSLVVYAVAKFAEKIGSK